MDILDIIITVLLASIILIQAKKIENMKKQHSGRELVCVAMMEFIGKQGLAKKFNELELANGIHIEIKARHG